MEDRHFLIVDSKQDNLFLTARQYPKLVLLEARVDDTILTLKDPEGKSMKVDLRDVLKKDDVRRGV